MWLTRQLDRVAGSDRPVVLLGGEVYGAPFVIDALRERERLAWVALPERARDDAVAQGNALASALDRHEGESLLPHALPYRAHLQLLLQYRHDLQPLWIAVSGAGVAPGFAQDLLSLAEHGYRVLLSFEPASPPLLDGLSGCLVLGPDELRVSRQEASLILPGGLGERELDALHRETQGRFTELLTAAHRAAQLPRMPIPSPFGPVLPQREAEAVDVPLAVLALQREGRLIEALELAVRAAPDMVEDLLRAAGPAYRDEGALPRLHLLLSSLPQPYRSQERVLEWRLVSAFATDAWRTMTEEVDAHLEAFGAPELRARRAGSLPPEQGFPLAEAAVRARRTPLTLWQYGRMHPDPEQAVARLKESVHVAEQGGTAYEVARAAGTLAARLIHLGQFQRARSWAEYALQVFDQNGLRDGARRLTLFNDLAVARILSGDLAGLRRGLEDSQASIEGSLPDLAATYRSTLAWFEQASGRPEVALELMHATFEGSPRWQRTRYAYQLVRCLNEFGRHDEARRTAEIAVELSGDASVQAGRLGFLARGMVRAVSGDDGAADDLLGVVLDASLPAEERLTGALHYLLSEEGGWHRLPADVTEALGALDPVALRVLSGPASAFQKVWDTLAPVRAELRLEFLGRVSCRLNGKEIGLGPRLAETALALALHRDGMTREELNAFLAADGTAGLSPSGLRATLTRLRALLPVSDAPYRFTVAYTADILEARGHLLEKRVREAITLLRGPLLPDSEALGVEEQRWILEEELRQAALDAADPDALFDLADRLRDDLELWDATVAALPPGDPRRALARARLRRGREDAAPAPSRRAQA
ncbi:MAG: hypothetical protein P8Y13_12955 [Deinococcales bacterium]